MKKKKVKKARVAKPVVTIDTVIDACSQHITHEHAYEMQKLAHENEESLTDKRLVSCLVDHSLDCEYDLYSSLSEQDKKKARKLIQNEARSLVGV